MKDFSPREFCTNRRIGSVEYSIEEFAYVLAALVPKFKEMQQGLDNLLNLGARFLNIECPIVPSLFVINEEATDAQKDITTARLVFVCQHVLSAHLDHPKNLEPTAEVLLNYLLKSKIKNIDLTIEDIITSNLSQIMLVLNDFILPTQDGEFDEDKGLDKALVIELSKMIDVILSYDEEIAQAKLADVEMASSNRLLINRIRELNNASRISEVNYLNSYLSLFQELRRTHRSAYVPYKFKTLQAHTAWALESLVLWLIAIQQDCILVMQSMYNVTVSFFQDIMPSLITRYQVEINRADLMTQYAQCMEWLVASPYKGLCDVLFHAQTMMNTNPIEIFMVAIKILQAELQGAIAATSVIMMAHPAGINELTPIMQYCDQFLQACRSMRECANGIAKIIAEKNDNKTGLLSAHHTLCEAHKLMLTPRSPVVRTPRVDSRTASNNPSPRGISSNTGSPRPSTASATSAVSPILSRGPSKNSSSSGSPRETSSLLLQQGIAKEDGGALPRLGASDVERKSRLVPKDSLRTANFKKAVARASEAMTSPKTEESAMNSDALTLKPSNAPRKNDSGSHSWSSSKADSPKVKGRPSVMTVFGEVDGEKLSLTRNSEGSASSGISLDLSKIKAKAAQAARANEPDAAHDHAVDNSTQTSDSGSSESSNTL